MNDLAPSLLALVIGAIVAAASAPLWARLATARGLVVYPRADRWHSRPTPLLGGLALGAGVLVAILFTRDAGGAQLPFVVAGAGVALALGLLDDARHLAPSTKLVGQVIAGGVLVVGGVRFELIPFEPLSFVVTVLWVVALMNAINLIDNMDGLAAGVVAIAAGMLTVTAAGSSPTASIVAASAAGASLGFLLHNFYPARIFMGDAGSMLLGYLLAAATLLHTATGAANVAVALIGPIIVLGLPIFDTALVVVSRLWAGLPISRGGRDHASHRLAALGLSDRAAVLFLYAVAAILALAGLALDAVSELLLPLGSLALALLALLGLFLVESDRGRAGREDSPRAALLRGLSTYVRFGFEVGLDVLFLTTAYYVAYLIRFEGQSEAVWLQLFARSVPFVVALQLLALVGLGIYRTLWRYLGISDVFAILRAIAIGSALAALALVLLERFQGYSRAVFVLDAILAAVLLVGSRAFVLWLRHWAAGRPRSGDRRVLIVGANDTGAVAARLLTRASDATYVAVGFLDDDPGKRYRQIAGVRVVGTSADLEAAVRRQNADLVVVATKEGAIQARETCERIGVEWREFKVPV